MTKKYGIKIRFTVVEGSQLMSDRTSMKAPCTQHPKVLRSLKRADPAERERKGLREGMRTMTSNGARRRRSPNVEQISESQADLRRMAVVPLSTDGDTPIFEFCPPPKIP